MKKTMLAIVVTGLFAATAQAANVYDNGGVMVDLYGRLQFAIRDSGKSGEDLDGVGSARLGFKVNSVINDDLKALGRGEWQINAENSTDDAEQLTARHVYVGLASNDLGQVVFGQTDTAFYQAVAATDIFNSFGYAAFNLI